MTGIAVVGRGYMGATHARAWSELGRAGDIRYVCAPGPGEPLEHAPQARSVDSLDVVLADPAVHLLSVCTPTPTHADIAIRALRAGKHVLLEKPVALTLVDARRIQDAAARSSGSLMVAQVVRFFAGYRRVHEQVQQGHLGTLWSARATRTGPAPTWASWFADEARSGGVLVDFAVHDFDQLNLLLGEPVALTCVGHGRPGAYETTVEYRSGAVGSVGTCSDLPAQVPFGSAVEVVGSAGVAHYRFSAAAPTEHPGGATGVSRLHVATQQSSALEDLPTEDPYTEQAHYFLSCVEAGREPARCPTGSAVLALEVALAARRSLETGTRVVLADLADSPAGEPA